AVERPVVREGDHPPSLRPTAPETKRAPRTSAAVTSRSERPWYVARMNALWTRLERWLEARSPALFATLGPPAAEEAIAAAERHLGLRFPADLRASLLVHEGQTDTPGL